MNVFKSSIFVIFLLLYYTIAVGQDNIDSNSNPKVETLKNYIQWTSNYASQKKFDSANKYASRALKLSEEINDKNLKASVIYNNAKIFYWQAKTKKAKEILSINLMNEELGDSIKIKSQQLLGTIFSYEENYQEALNVFINIEKDIRNKGILTRRDSIIIGESFLDIGLVHRAIKNNDKAQSFYNKALLYSKNPNFENAVLFYKSTLFEEGNKLRESINYSLRGVEISIKNKLDVLLPSYYASISYCYLKLGIADSAIYYGKIGLKDNTDCQLEFLNNNVGKGYALTKKYNAAIKYFENALKHSSDNLSVEIHESMRDVYISKGNYKKAIHHNENYLTLKSSLDSLRIRQELFDITEKYESEKKQFKIDILQTKNNHSTFVIKKQKTQIVLISTTLLMSLLLLIFIIFSFRKQKRHKNFLFDKNKQFAKKLKNNQFSELAPIQNETISIDNLQKEKIHTFIIDAVKEEFYLNSNLSLASLAKSANTNTTYLSKIINEDFNKSFVVFINDLRISYTLQQLEVIPEYRNLTIDNIAYKAGFSSNSAFYNAFKKFTGLTPSYYIKKRLQLEG